MAQARRPSLYEQEQLEQRLFESVARYFAVPITHIRRVTYRFHTGEHLSIKHIWHVLEGDDWRQRDYSPPQGRTGPYPK